MTRSEFPYLTIETATALGVTGLNWAATEWPELAGVFRTIGLLLPLVTHVPAVAQALQHLFDTVNGFTGAVPTS